MYAFSAVVSRVTGDACLQVTLQWLIVATIITRTCLLGGVIIIRKLLLHYSSYLAQSESRGRKRFQSESFGAGRTYTEDIDTCYAFV